ncbi:hypothetical protein ACTPDI_20415 [Clostridioides difficile]|nr:hypothetical protein [Clostridioides difficile]KJF62423.1 hypothetical protein TZ54_15375 [Clostridioides difficile]
MMYTRPFSTDNIYRGGNDNNDGGISISISITFPSKKKKDESKEEKFDTLPKIDVEKEYF